MNKYLPKDNIKQVEVLGEKGKEGIQNMLSQ